MSIFFFTEESAEWPLEDLKVKYEVMLTVSIEETYDTRRGKVRWISKTEQGFAIREGNISKAEWRSRAEKAIHENGLDSLLEEIKEHCRKYCAWLKREPESELELYAMQCLASRAYEAWENFGRDLG